MKQHLKTSSCKPSLNSMIPKGLMIMLAVSFLLLIPDISAVFASSSTGILAPLYVFPDGTNWQPLIDAKNNHPQVPMIAVINQGPFGGPPPVCSTSDAYVQNVPKLIAAGIKVLGYVDTSRATRLDIVVQGEINKWHECYNELNGINLSGIFFDQMKIEAGAETYYSALTNYTKSKPGFTITIGNPGGDTSPTYVGTVDNIVIHEHLILPTLSQLDGWHANHDKSNFSYLVWGQPTLDTTFVSQSSNHVAYLYITESPNALNPWDRVSSHIETLAQILDVPSVGMTIDSKDLAGNPISGSGNNIVISANGVDVRRGPSPLFYNATSNTSYTITAANFGSFVFDHWENSSTNPTRTVTPTQSTTYTAFYRTS